MAKFQPNKININSINMGNKWEEGQSPSVDTFNAPIEASAYAQAIATNQPNITNAGLVGTPSVSIEEVNGMPRLKFENLKGEKGQDGTDHREEIEELQYAIKRTESKVDILSEDKIKQIDIEQEYSLRITADEEDIFNGNTLLESIKGNAVKSENLLIPPFQTETAISNGISYIDKKDGTINIKGTSTGISSYSLTNEQIYKANNTYYLFSKNPSILIVIAYQVAGEDGIKYFSTTKNNNHISFDWKESYTLIETYLQIGENETINEDSYLPFISESQTKSPTKWFAGLKDSSFKFIKSTNEQFIPYNYASGDSYTESGITFEKQLDGGIKIRGTATETVNYYLYTTNGLVLPKGKYIASIKNNNQSKFIIGGAKSNLPIYAMSKDGTHYFEFSEENHIGYCVVQVQKGSTNLNETVYPMINYGETVLGYKKQEFDLFKLFSEIDLYGYDEIDLKYNKIIRQTGKVEFDGITEGKKVTQISSLNDDFIIGICTTKDLSNYQNSVISSLGWDNNTRPSYSSKEKGVYLAGENYKDIYIWFSKSLFKEADISSVDKINNYLYNLWLNNNPLVVEYKKVDFVTDIKPFFSNEEYKLYPYYDSNKKETNGVTFTSDTNGNITIKTISSGASGYATYFLANNYLFEEGYVYSFKSNMDGIQFVVSYENSLGETKYFINTDFVWEKGFKNLYVYIQIPMGSYFNGVVSPKMQKIQNNGFNNLYLAKNKGLEIINNYNGTDFELGSYPLIKQIYFGKI